MNIPTRSCNGRYLVVGTNTGYIRVVRMPTEEEDTAEHHYVTWMNAQQKLLKKLKGRRLAKEEVNLFLVDTEYVLI